MQAVLLKSALPEEPRFEQVCEGHLEIYSSVRMGHAQVYLLCCLPYSFHCLIQAGVNLYATKHMLSFTNNNYLQDEQLRPTWMKQFYLNFKSPMKLKHTYSFYTLNRDIRKYFVLKG